MAKDIIGWRELLLIGGSVKAGLFKALDGKEYSTSEMADNLNYSPRALEIVLEALKSLGYLKKVHSHYSLTEKSRGHFVDKQSNDYCVGSVMHSLRLINNWLKLDQAIITGKSQSSARSSEELSFFVGAMHEGSVKKAKEVVKKVLSVKKDTKKLLDLGGGPGSFAKGFADKNIEVTMMDTPAVVDLVLPELKKHRNIKVVKGDFHKELPQGKYDVILMSNICHIYNPEKNIELFARAKKSLYNHGVLVIVDFVRHISPGAELFAVNMLVNTAGGGTWTKDQYHRWLREAGLRLAFLMKLGEGDQALMIAK